MTLQGPYIARDRSGVQVAAGADLEQTATLAARLCWGRDLVIWGHGGVAAVLLFTAGMPHLVPVTRPRALAVELPSSTTVVEEGSK